MFSRTEDVVKKPNPLIDALLCTTVGEVREKADVKFLRHDDKVSTLMHALVRHKYLSFPVVDDEGEVLGVVDGADLIAFLQKQQPDRAVEVIHTTSVLHLIDISQSNPYLPVFTTTSLHGVISILAPGCHRTVVFVSEESTQIHAIFSETDLVRTLFRLMTLAEDLSQATLDKLNQFQSQIKALAHLPISAFAAHRSRPSQIARDTDPLSSAIAHVLEFRRLSDAGLQAASPSEKGEKGPSLALLAEPPRAPLVAVFNDQGMLIGHLGAADLNHSIYGSDSVFASVSVAFPHDEEKRSTKASEVTSSPESSSYAGDFPHEDPKHERSHSAVQTALSALQLTLAKYLQQYSPDSLEPIIVRESIPFVHLLSLLSHRHKHQVWVLSEEGSTGPQGDAEPNTMQCGETRTLSSPAWLPYLVQGEVDGTKLQVLTLTDILRWVARDELTLTTEAHLEGL